MSPEERNTITLSYFGKPVEIDEEIAPLMKELWDADIRTSFCCQEFSPGMVGIWFPFISEAEKFIQIIHHLTPPDYALRSYIRGIGRYIHSDEEGFERFHWIYEVDAGVLVDGSIPRFRIHVLFPTEHIDMVYQCLKEYNDEGYFLDRHGNIV